VGLDGSERLSRPRALEVPALTQKGTTVTKPSLHPWLATPEASVAARKAVRIPLALLGGKAVIVDADELLSEADAILTECALPPRVSAF
jgi:hypothetical protein